MPLRPPSFRPPQWKPPQQVEREYDNRRGSARSRGYDTRWDKEAAAFKREHPLCLGCEAIGRVTATALVDHVEPHKGDMDKFYDRSMWQPSCVPHHSIVKQELERRFALGKVKRSDLWLNSEAAKALTHRLLRL